MAKYLDGFDANNIDNVTVKFRALQDHLNELVTAQQTYLRQTSFLGKAFDTSVGSHTNDKFKAQIDEANRQIAVMSAAAQNVTNNEFDDRQVDRRHVRPGPVRGARRRR